jgi:membrane protein YdbS with pleckstrin-like domain
VNERRVLRTARDAIRHGDHETGRNLLLQVIQANPRNEVAWLWLSAVIDDPARERECLERVIEINPDNALAQKHLLKLRLQSYSDTAPAAGAPPPAAAPEPDIPTELPPAQTAPAVRISRYVARNLLPGEQVAHTTRLAPTVFILPVLALLTGGVGLALVNHRGGVYGTLAKVLTVVILALVAYLAWKAIRFVASEFVVTNRRVLIKVGPTKRSTFELPLSQVEGTSVDQGPAGRMANVGTVVIDETGGVKTRVRNVVRPMAFRRAVSEQLAGRHGAAGRRAQAAQHAHAARQSQGTR